MLAEFSKVIKDIPCPFVVSRTANTREEDEDKIKVIQEFLNWDWENGGKIRFFEKYSNLYVNDIISNYTNVERKTK